MKDGFYPTPRWKIVPARLVEMPQGDPLPALAAHIKGLIEAGHWVLLSSARTPGPELLRRLPGFGVDLEKVVIVDTATPRDQQTGADPQRLLYMPSPALLELLTLRSEKVVWARRKEKTHILVHDMNAFARHNPPEALEQMMRYVMTRVRSYTTVDLCVDVHAPIPETLLAALRSFCEERIELEPPP